MASCTAPALAQVVSVSDRPLLGPQGSGTGMYLTCGRNMPSSFSKLTCTCRLRLGGGRGDSSSLSLPHRQGALWRHVVSLLCADCSRQRRGGCGGGWHTRLRQLGPASFCLFWKPTQALPLASRDMFPVGRVAALVPQPPACREETVQGQAWVCCIH